VRCGAAACLRELRSALRRGREVLVFPKALIDETKAQTDRDLTRFDLDFDVPQHFLPEFPAPIYLTTRLDLGDVSHGKLVTLANHYDLFSLL
jgi:cytochrome c peroxidase